MLDLHGINSFEPNTFLIFAAVYNPVMHNSDWNQPKPVHLHWEIHGGIISSPGTHENDLGTDNGLLLLW